MRCAILCLCLMVMACYVRAQYVYTINADSVKITNHCDSEELIIQNHTQGVVGGFLYNTGNGRTLFQKVLRKINDSTYLVGPDSLKVVEPTETSQLINNSGFITAAALAPYAPLNSPSFSGVPVTSTPPNGTSTTQLADTKFVMNNINQMLDTCGFITASALVPYAPLNSPVLSGVPQVSTPPNGTSTNQIADTKFVMNNINQMLDTGGFITESMVSSGVEWNWYYSK